MLVFLGFVAGAWVGFFAAAMLAVAGRYDDERAVELKD